MDINEQDYLNLFKKINQDQDYQSVEKKDYTFEQLRGNATNINSYEPVYGNSMNLNNYYNLNETPNYANYETYKNVNEVTKQNYSMDYNLNEFNIETRINGENINEIRQIRREEKEARLNEVMQQMREKIQEEKESKNINEKVNFDNVEYVTLEMFEKARYNSMMNVKKSIDVICR
jgi:HD-GYP domain-containing protein (c-di-GMP phosphodiesterase class II)